MDNNNSTSNYVIYQDLGSATTTSIGFPQGILAENQKSENSRGIHPQLYFNYVKSKFRPVEQKKLERQFGIIEKAFDKAMEAGQEALAADFLRQIVRETREAQLIAKGINYFIEEEDLHKFKYSIRDGHISDTPLQHYTRLIPAEVVKKKKAVEELFDSFIVYHYWTEDARDVKAMSPETKQRMQDPVLFGRMDGSNRYYFVADWIDEYCDLTFDDIINRLGERKSNFKLGKVDLEGGGKK